MFKNVFGIFARVIGEVPRKLNLTDAVSVVPDEKAVQVSHVAAHLIDRRDINLEFDERYREICPQETYEKFERSGERERSFETLWK